MLVPKEQLERRLGQNAKSEDEKELVEKENVEEETELDIED